VGKASILFLLLVRTWRTGYMHPLCSILQYVDDLVVYTSGKHVEAVETACRRL
jgi:hypothetical protein